jgi:hypothetical protein
MQWSQLKKQLKDRFAGSVAASIDLNQTRYRHSHDQEGEFWISFSGSRIFSAGSMTYLSALADLAAKHKAEGATPAEAYEKAWTVMEASGLMLLEQINRDLFGSLSQTVEEMLVHRNPIIRALAVIDSRYGKRRLATFDPDAEHQLVQHLYRLRCEAEGLAPRAPWLDHGAGNATPPV